MYIYICLYTHTYICMTICIKLIICIYIYIYIHTHTQYTRFRPRAPPALQPHSHRPAVLRRGGNESLAREKQQNKHVTEEYAVPSRAVPCRAGRAVLCYCL